MLIIRIQDSEMWYKAIMAIIALIVSIRLIYDIKKSKIISLLILTITVLFTCK